MCTYMRQFSLRYVIVWPLRYLDMHSLNLNQGGNTVLVEITKPNSAASASSTVTAVGGLTLSIGNHQSGTPSAVLDDRLFTDVSMNTGAAAPIACSVCGTGSYGSASPRTRLTDCQCLQTFFCFFTAYTLVSLLTRSFNTV